MKTYIQNFEEISDELLKSYGKELNTFERLSLAVQIERNQILENGLQISKTDEYPPALGAIAIALGFTEPESSTVAELLRTIADQK